MAKILLVEDDNNLREIYEARLQAEGYEIVTAQDGEEALAVAVKEKPDLIISDVMMPKISGFDMLDILRGTPETKNAKVIMMTALSQAEDKDRADKLGADRYLVKSQVTLEDVAKVAKEVLESDGSQVPPQTEASVAPEAVAPTTPAPSAKPSVPTPDATTAPTPVSVTPEPVQPAEPTASPAQAPVAAAPTMPEPSSTPFPVVTTPSDPTVAATSPATDDSTTAATPATDQPASSTPPPPASEPATAEPSAPVTVEPSTSPTVLPDVAVPSDATTAGTHSNPETTTTPSVEPVLESTTEQSPPVSEDGSVTIPGLPPLYDNPPEGATPPPAPHPLELDSQTALPNTPPASEGTPSGQTGAPFLVSEPAPAPELAPATPPAEVDESAKIAASIESFLATKAENAPAAPAATAATEAPASTTVPVTPMAANPLMPEPTAPEVASEPTSDAPTAQPEEKQTKSGYKVIQPLNDMTKPPVDLEAMAKQEEELGAAQQILNTPVTKPGDPQVEQQAPPPHQAGQTIDPTSLAL